MIKAKEEWALRLLSSCFGLRLQKEKKGKCISLHKPSLSKRHTNLITSIMETKQDDHLQYPLQKDFDHLENQAKNKISCIFWSSLEHLEWQKPLTLTKALAAAGRVFIAGTRCSWSPADMSFTQVTPFGKNSPSLGMMKCLSAIMYSNSTGSIPYSPTAPNPGMLPSARSSRLHQPGKSLHGPGSCSGVHKQNRWDAACSCLFIMENKSKCLK